MKEEVENSIQSRFKDFDWKFKTFGDKTLERMLKEVQDFCLNVETSKSWLTLSGPTEIGKTHLLKSAYKFLMSCNINIKREYGHPYVWYFSWPDLRRRLFSKDKNEEALEYVNGCGALFIEEFLCENFDKGNAYTNITIDMAHEVLNLRDGRPLIMDTNKSMNEFSEIDVRIASRLTRNNSKFLTINKDVKLYSKR